MPRWWRRLRARLRYRQFDAELKEELEIHRAMAQDDLTASGATAEAARTGAARRLGNVLLAREAARHVWIAPWLEGLWQDLSYAFRSLRKTPGFTATALVTLTVTIGLTTNFFALVHGLAFRPWPVPDPDRLVVVEAERTFPDFTVEGMYLAEYVFLREHAKTLDLMAMVPDRVQVGSQPDQPIRS